MVTRKMLTALLILAAATALPNALNGQSVTAASYTLRTINGQPLPAPTETGAECREEVLSGSIVLESDGEWEMKYVEQETCGSDVEQEEEAAEGNYTIAGQVVSFSTEVDDYEAGDVDIDELGRGELRADGLIVTLRDGETVLLFGR